MVRIGLVGTGHINEEHLLASKLVKNVSITSVFSRNKSKALEFSKKFDIKNYYDNYDDMLNSDKIDAVLIGVPTPYHKEFAIRAIKKQKHVLCEKPLSLTLEDAEEMSNYALARNVILMTAHVLRFWPEYVKVKELLSNGSLGNIKNAYLYRYSAIPKWSTNNWLLDPTQSGGVPVDLQIHDIDFCLWLLGEPTSINAVGNSNENNFITNSSCIFGYPDSTVILQSGYILGENLNFEMGFRIISDHAVLDYNNLMQPTLTIKKDASTREEINVDKLNAYSQQLAYFADCILQKKTPKRITVVDAVKSLKLSLTVKSLIESSFSKK